jgi:hypothetical protein
MNISGISIDFVQLAANAVPGMVAADLLQPGSFKDIAVGGGVTAVTAENFAFVDESSGERLVREIYKKALFLGFGAGYAAGRLAGADAKVNIALGAVFALMLMEVRKRQTPIYDVGDMPGQSLDPGKAPIYQSTLSSPQSAPVARGLVSAGMYTN